METNKKKLYSSKGYKKQAQEILRSLGLVCNFENMELARRNHEAIMKNYEIYRQNIGDQIQLM